MQTVWIDDDVFNAASDLAAQEHKSVGEFVSQLVKLAAHPARSVEGKRLRLPVLPVRDTSPVTQDFVNKLRDRLGV